MGIKVLHIVAGDLSGGAARGAYALHQGLLNCDIDSKILIQYAAGHDSNVQPVVTTRIQKIMREFQTRIDDFSIKLYRNRENSIFSTGFIGYDFRKYDIYQWADIVHLHWINNGMIDVKLLNKIDKPIIWTMRDMWPMTGGCHYAMDCMSYKTNCGYCPQLGSKHRFDLSWYILKRKKRYYPKKIHFVATSNWLADCANNSALLKNHKIRVIHNGIDTEAFSPIDRDLARDLLGLPKNKKIILVGAINLHDKYKGFDKFQDLVCHLMEKPLFLFFGEVNKDELKKLNIDFHTLGFLSDTFSLRLAYSAADLFLALSVQEAFGKTLIESMACGIPVVCFDATGPKDIVDHRVNGYKAAPFDVTDVANGITWVLNSPNYSSLSKNAREKVIQSFDLNFMAKQYIALYNEVEG